jgi:hypothetical protein
VELDQRDWVGVEAEAGSGKPELMRNIVLGWIDMRVVVMLNPVEDGCWVRSSHVRADAALVLSGAAFEQEVSGRVHQDASLAAALLEPEEVDAVEDPSADLQPFSHYCPVRWVGHSVGAAAASCSFGTLIVVVDVDVAVGGQVLTVDELDSSVDPDPQMLVFETSSRRAYSKSSDVEELQSEHPVSARHPCGPRELQGGGMTRR